MNILDEIGQEAVDKATAERQIPEFGPGDTLRVDVRVVEGSRERVQAFEGVCIARKGGGVNSSFTVRKISYGEGVERIFPLYSPRVAKITVLRRGDVRRAKLYYLRGRTGKAARISEKARDSIKADSSKAETGETTAGTKPAASKTDGSKPADADNNASA